MTYTPPEPVLALAEERNSLNERINKLFDALPCGGEYTEADNENASRVDEMCDRLSDLDLAIFTEPARSLDAVLEKARIAYDIAARDRLAAQRAGMIEEAFPLDEDEMIRLLIQDIEALAGRQP